MIENDENGQFIENDSEIPYQFVQSIYLIKQFLDKYFIKIDFESFDSLNRHAFAHGRQQYYATRVDVVKLILLLQALLVCIMKLNSLLLRNSNKWLIQL